MARRLNKQERLIEDLRKKLEPTVRAAFDAAIAAAKTSIDRKALLAALEQAGFGNMQPALQLLTLNAETLFPLTEAVRATYIAGGASVSGSIPIALQGRFNFGGNPRAVSAVGRIVGELIQGIEAESLAAARAVIVAGVGEGIPPARLAQDIVGRTVRGKLTGGKLGMNTQQLEIAQSVKDILSDPASYRKFFIKDSVTGQFKPRYKTTNRNSVRTVAKAIREKRALTAKELATITTAHEQRLLRLRGETIARTEALNALRAGRHDGFGTLLDSGLIEDNELIRTWSSASDNRVRPDHAEMNGQQVIGLDTPFTFPDGSQALYPGDSSRGAPADQLINCRCGSTTRLLMPGRDKP